MCRQKFLSDAAACLSVMFGSRVLFMLLMLAMGMPFPRDLRAQQVTAPGVAAISELRVLPGHERDVERAVEQVREATLKDPGCAYFFVTTRQGDSTTIFLFEEFRSSAAFQKHVEAARRGAATGTQSNPNSFLVALASRPDMRDDLNMPSESDVTSADAISIASRSSAPMPGPSMEPRNTNVPSPILFLIHTECFPHLARASL